MVKYQQFSYHFILKIIVFVLQILDIKEKNNFGSKKKINF